MKAKEYLLQEGKISAITRGRISNDNHAFLKKAWEGGVRFSDWAPKGESPTADSSKPKRESSAVGKGTSSQPKTIAEIHIPFPESEYIAFERRGGKRHLRSMRSACTNCRVSLVACGCFASGMPARIVAEDGRGPDGSGSVLVYLDKKKVDA